MGNRLGRSRNRWNGASEHEKKCMNCIKLSDDEESTIFWSRKILRYFYRIYLKSDKCTI
jgi:hypothetical protein